MKNELTEENYNQAGKEERAAGKAAKASANERAEENYSQQGIEPTKNPRPIKPTGRAPKKLPTQRHSNNPQNKAMRRELRTIGTPAEAYLWPLLKNRTVNGVRFRRQFGIDRYILDFYCPELKLAIELDGDPHYTEKGSQHDERRDRYLTNHYGITTLRIENKVVFENFALVTNAIFDIVEELQAKKKAE